MRIERLSVDPEVLLLRDFVTEAEAQALKAAADAHFKRSSTVCEDPAGCLIPERTSSSATVPASALTEALQKRGRDFTGLPVAEAIQVVRYGPGEEFQPHLDAFDSSGGGAHAKAQYEGRQRAATLLIYLNGPDAGGETIFPKLGLRIAPIPRAAIFWRNLMPDGAIDSRTLHGGSPVQKGVKYAANLWLRGEPDPIYAFALTEDVAAPTEASPSSSKETAVFLACGVGLGAAIGGPPGALVGGAVGWTLDVLRRRMTA